MSSSASSASVSSSSSAIATAANNCGDAAAVAAAGAVSGPVDGSFFHALHTDLVDKVDRFGKPKPAQILALLRKMTPDARRTYGWEGVEISLRNPDHGVREIERTFRKLGWDFDLARIVPGSRPPDFDLFLQMLKDLARYFDEHPVAQQEAEAEGGAGATKSVWAAPDSSSDSGGGGGGGGARPAKKELKYWVKGSKKGTFRITKERRKRGKFVTVVGNVGGDVTLMLKELRGALGTGGTYNAESNALEMQGDCAAAVEKWLVRSQCLVGVTAKIKAAITQEEDRKKDRESARKAKANAVRQTQLERQRRDKAVDATKPLATKEVRTMKPDALKAHLQARGMSTQGTKKELLARLLAFAN